MPRPMVQDTGIGGSELGVIWAVALYSASAGIGVYAMLATAAGHFAVVRIEEPELRERFGASYESYCQRVPRWVPRFGRSASQSVEESSLRGS